MTGYAKNGVAFLVLATLAGARALQPVRPVSRRRPRGRMDSHTQWRHWRVLNAARRDI
jgi:hypothetical protein